EKQNKILEVKKNFSNEINNIKHQIIETNKKINKKEKIKGVKIGQTVKVNSIDQIGTVLSMPDEKGNLDLQVGIMKINVNLSDLSIYEEDSNKDLTYNKKYNKNTLTKSKQIKKELDLRGYDIENAIMKID
ncbi:hypothetical protein HKB01_03505, partial [Vibrio parahaemolyticus]|nr:hypothetical protein [Vibrio parahaemolyticus]